MFSRYIIKGIGLAYWTLSFVACETAPKTPEAFLKTRFPHLVEEIQWDSSKTNEIGAFFSDSTGTYEVYFERTGQFKILYTYLNVADLPKTVHQAVRGKYPQSHFAILSLMETPQKKSYHMELETDKDYITLEMDAAGNWLQEKVVPLSEQELRNAEEEGVDD
ncbi:MAG: hypothetical protein RL329_3278 [Bacteroidota bacterium]|jgi:hypothetical protein